MKKSIIYLLAIIMASSAALAQSPKRELRQVWFTTYLRIDWPTTAGTSSSVQTKQKNELITYLDNFDKRNFNGICFQSRSLCDAMYQSSYEPWSAAISGTRGTSPGWDPLAYAVEECHKRGLECWAWINPFRQRKTASNYTTQFDKDWAANGWLLGYDDYYVMDPSNPDARAHILKVIKEIYTNYKVDGLLFDDYFYPNNIPEDSSAGDYNTWKNSGTSLSFGDWRRENINSFMRELYAQIANDRPDLRFGLSPAGVAYLGALQYGYSKPNVKSSDWQYGTIYSDPAAWLKDGSVDFISPQIYWITTHSTAPYGPLSQWWSQIAHDCNRHFYSSQGSYRIYDGMTTNDEAGWSEMALEVNLNRQYNHDNAPGSIWYSAKYFDGPTCTGMGEYLANNVYQNKALAPILQWKANPGYAAPTGLNVSAGKLSWNVVAGKKSNSIVRYTIYAIPQSVSPAGAMATDGDGIEARYLLDVCYGTSYTLPSAVQSGYWYAVCTYDGYGYESAPATCNYNGQGDDPHGEVGYYEPGYTVQVDPANYPTTSMRSLTNEWMRSIRSDFGNISFESEGLLNRGIAISGDVLYMSGRYEASSSSAIYLAKYDLATGERIGTLDLGDEGKVSYYPCNDVQSDQAGNVFISNLTLDAVNNPIVVHKVNLSTGALTEVARLNATGDKMRVDHIGIYGNISSGPFYVFAAQASGTRIVRWTVNNGTVTETKSVTISSFSPKSATSFGIAPKCWPKSADLVWVDGQGTYPALYNINTGAMVEAYADKAALLPQATGANGMCFFNLGTNSYSVVAHNAAVTDGQTWQYLLTTASGSNASITAHDALWTIPQGGLGDANPGSYSSPCCAVVNDDGTATIAIFSCGNGLAVYTLADNALTGTGSAATEAQPSWKINGRTVQFGYVTDVKIYTLSGALVASTLAGSYTLPEAGAWIVSTPQSSKIISVK